MGQHYSSPDNQELLISQLRVTPLELTQALAAIEVRKQKEIHRQEEEAHYLSETLDIRDAVRDLGVEASPEEIWNEVQFQRNADQRSGEPHVKYPDQPPLEVKLATCQPFNRENNATRRGTKVKLTAAFGLIFFICYAAWLHSINSYSSRLQNREYTTSQFPSPLHTFANPSKHKVSTPDAEFYRKLSLSQGPHAQYHMMLVADEGYESSILSDELAYSPRAIPDAYSVYGCPQQPLRTPNTYIVFRDASETRETRLNSLQQIGSIYNFFSAPVVTVTRYDNRDYLRCWIAKKEITALHLGHALVLYTSPSVTSTKLADIVPLTVSISSLTLASQSAPGGKLISSPGQARNGQFLPPTPKTEGYLINIPEGCKLILDSHAWENFPALNFPHYDPPSWVTQTDAFSDHGNYLKHEQFSEFDAGSDVVNLKQIPDGRNFHCGVLILSNILLALSAPDYVQSARVPLSEILIDQRPRLEMPYTLVKYQCKIYLRGWVTGKIKASVLQKHDMPVYGSANAPELGDTPTQITFPIDTCSLQLSTSSTMVLAHNIHLDSHAYEKWQP